MCKLYKRIENICKENNTNITAMCKGAGISRAALTELKMGRNKTLSYETLSKIANYFHISVDYVTGNEQKEAPTLTKEDERDIKNKIDDILDTLSHQEGLMFDGNPLTPEALESIRNAMELGMAAATIKNKRKKDKKESTNGRAETSEKPDKKVPDE
jgi:transcriptional regulator with XRE-family HTH domain